MSDREQEELPAAKKRRITKACDRCRSKRQRCLAGPNPDGPCKICIDTSSENLCTFKRLSKRRGPQKGVAQSLGERVNALERLLGYLLLVDPAIASMTEPFFSPSVPPLHTPAEQLVAFRASSLPHLLEEVAPTPPAPENATASDMMNVEDRMSLGEGSAWNGSPLASGSGASNSPFSRAPIKVASYNPGYSSTISNVLSFPSLSHENRLQTLATAAFGDYTTTEASGAIDEIRRTIPNSLSLPSAPSLPTEMVRNQLVDLYFSQTVHLSYPMLDKARFFRWSAQVPLDGGSARMPTVPPELYLAVFAITIPYLTPASARSGIHSAESFAAASRGLLYENLGKPTIESVQACCILALYDWGAGSWERAWVLSSLAVALSIRLSLHMKSSDLVQSLGVESNSESYKLKTFYSSVIIHTLLSLRLSRSPLLVLDDYNVPLPPHDGPENFELWRGETAEDLRNAYGPVTIPSPRPIYMPRAHAVRSCSLSAFSQTAKLSISAISIIRWGANPKGDSDASPARESERLELVNQLTKWERELPAEIRLSEETRGIDAMAARSRHVVELHLLLFTLYQRLAPSITLSSIAYDPVPAAAEHQAMILLRFLDIFTIYRCLPTIELYLHSLAGTLFRISSELSHLDAVLRAFLELGSVFPGASSSYASLRTKSDEQARELSSMATNFAPPPSILPPILPEYLDYSGTPNNTSDQYLDFGHWDQNDLLIPLGLVVDHAGLSWTIPEVNIEDMSNNSMERNLMGNVSLPMGMESVLGQNMGTPPFNGQIGSEDNRTPSGIQIPGLNVYGNAQSTDLFERWMDKGMLDFGDAMNG